MADSERPRWWGRRVQRVQCRVCDRHFDAIRSDARCCSSRCRMAMHRALRSLKLRVQAKEMEEPFRYS